MILLFWRWACPRPSVWAKETWKQGKRNMKTETSTISKPDGPPNQRCDPRSNTPWWGTLSHWPHHRSPRTSWQRWLSTPSVKQCSIKHLAIIFLSLKLSVWRSISLTTRKVPPGCFSNGLAQPWFDLQNHQRNSHQEPPPVWGHRPSDHNKGPNLATIGRRKIFSLWKMGRWGGGGVLQRLHDTDLHHDLVELCPQRRGMGWTPWIGQETGERDRTTLRNRGNLSGLRWRDLSN